MPEYDGSTHFDALMLSSFLHASFAFRSQAEINQHTHGSGQLDGQPDGNNAQIKFDPAMNAAKVTVPANQSGISLAWQLRPEYPAIDKTTGHDEVSVQWEARWSSDWLDAKFHGINVNKAFQVAKNIGDGRKIELQTRFIKTDNSAVALPTIRAYDAETGGDGSSDPIRTDEGSYFNWQPGGNTHAPHNRSYSASDHLKGEGNNNAFVIRPDTWIRFTVSITFTGGVQRVRMWMSDENTPPTLVIADPFDPAQGFLYDMSPENSGTDHFWFEFNSSQSNTTNPELVAWVRNVVVFGDATVPLDIGDIVPPPPTPPPPPQSQTFTLHIDPEPPVDEPEIVSGLPSPGQVRQPYSHAFRAVKGLQPYRWMSSGLLPPGLFFQSTSKPNESILSGTPTSSGDFTVTIWPENARPDGLSG